MKCLLLFLSIALATKEHVVVHLKQGSYRGEKHKHHTHFLGIRYAQPVTRFSPPQPITDKSVDDSVIEDATTWKNSCPQFPNSALTGFSRDLLKPRAGEPEDCLFLNVFLPNIEEIGEVRKKLPVLIFIHGGAFHSGSSSALIYDPSDWIRHFPEFLLVTFDYRLGPLGYMAVPHNTNQAETTGNFGLLDQIQAIKWVHDNIRSFGGDPNNLTIMGHSAGAISASWIAALETKIFPFPISGYVLMSGVGLMWHQRSSTGEFEKLQYDSFLKETGCAAAASTSTNIDAFECLRRVGLDKIKEVNEKLQTGYTWGPTIDGHLINAPFHLMDHYNPNAHIMISAVRDEGSIFVPEDYKEIAQVFFKNKLPQILPFYGRKLNFHTINAILTDGLFICPLNHFFRERQRNSPNPKSIHYYLLRHPMILTSLASTLNQGKDYGVFHGSDVLMLFGNQRLLSNTYHSLVKELRRGIVQFASNGTVPEDSHAWNNEQEKLQNRSERDLFMMEYENWSVEDHHCDFLWNSNEPLIPKNYKSKLPLPESPASRESENLTFTNSLTTFD